jgi:hypothetical protein
MRKSVFLLMWVCVVCDSGIEVQSSPFSIVFPKHSTHGAERLLIGKWELIEYRPSPEWS